MTVRGEPTMSSRRDFVKSIAGAALSMQKERREALLGKRRVKVVDIHGHFVAPEELDVVKNTNLARNISNNLNGPLILGPSRIQFMDQQGIDIQVLSHQGGWWYEADRNLAGQIVKVQNEKLAAW